MVNNYTEEKDRELANFMKALSHPARLMIIRKIIEKSACPCGCHPCSCGEKCDWENCKCGCKCGELVNFLPMAQSTVSQHIKELKNAGIITISNRKGDYTLNYQKLKEGLDLLNLLLGFDGKEVLENQYQCCKRIGHDADKTSNQK